MRSKRQTADESLVSWRRLMCLQAGGGGGWRRPRARLSPFARADQHVLDDICFVEIRGQAAE